MPFAQPTPYELRARLAAEVQAALPGADARLRRSVEEIVVRMIALAAGDMHGHLAWAAEQLLPDSAEAELLERHAAIWGITRRPPATASGPVTLSGAADAPVLVPAGTEFRRSDDARYLLDADADLVDGAGAGTVTAVLGGVEGNAAEGQALSPVAPVSGLTGAAVAAGGLTGGLASESDDELRARIISRIQAPPAGGDAEDYRQWALAVPGVARAFVFPAHAGLGTVGVIPLGPDGALPSDGLVADVQSALDAQRPVTADVYVFAPPTLEVAVTLTISPDNDLTRAAVQAAIVAFFAEEAAPGQILRLSRLSEAISGAAGEVYHRLSSPSADVAPAGVQLPVLGTVTFDDA